MRPGAARWTVLATAALAVALFLALPWFAATVVRGAIERESSRDRIAFAAGGSPWSWQFHQPDDVVAGHAFGGGKLVAADDALQVHPTDGSGFEIGLPLQRVADLRHMTTLRLTASASAPGHYGLAVRPSLAGPLLHADLGTQTPDALDRPIRLDQLPWIDDAGHPVAAPTRAAMLRLSATLPGDATLTLRAATLAPATALNLPAAIPVPNGLSTEALLNWRDALRERDPLATFGKGSPHISVPAWQPWLAPGLYLVLIFIAAAVRATYRAPRPDSRNIGANPPRTDAAGKASSVRQPEPGDAGATQSPTALVDAALVLAGPLWFIATLGLSTRPHPAGITMFAIGAVYALVLATRRRLPGWHWLGSWRAAGWPLLALPVAVVLALAAGHAPIWPPAGRALVYVGWALFQQWLMLAVVGALLARALPKPLAVLLIALAFALLHTPNGLLMQLCFVAELGWAWWYLHHRALWPVAVAHAGSALLLQACLAGGLLRSLEVSARYLN